ncbi:MAG: phospholipid carrier-dependent glycosyltransferase, partial [Anaerolineae bacterium]
INIQQAHFFTMDSFAATFVALTFYFALWVADRGSWRDFIGMGISYGCAVACRINVAIIALVMGLAFLWRIYQLYRSPPVVEQIPVRVPSKQQWEWTFGGVRIALKVNSHANEQSEPPAQAPVRQVERTWLDAAYSLALKAVVCAVFAFLAFRIAQPYTFQGPGFFGLKLSENWLRDMRNWSPILSGKADSYPSHQWAARPPVLYTLTNMVLWLVGVPMGLASWAGWGLAWYELLRKRFLQHLLPLAWTTFAFFYHSTQFIKNPRYLVPFYPFMALMAAYLLVYLWDRARSVQFRWAKPAAIAVVAFVTIGTFLWAFAFTRIYTRPHTWVTASRWIYENIPKGSAITGEAWGDWLPWGGVDGRNGFADGTYTGIEMHPYAEDSPEKLGWFMDWLNQADYII